VVHGLLGSLASVNASLGFERLEALASFPPIRASRGAAKIFNDLPFQ